MTVTARVPGREAPVLIACSECPTGVLVEVDGGLGYRCSSCAYDDTVCDCGERMTFDPQVRGTTCGGNAIVGARVCVPCGLIQICRLSRSADAVGWVLASSGVSLTAGALKLRAEASGDRDAIKALMARIVRVPALELEIAQLRAALAQRKAGSS